jgi:ABC-type transporter MlaC component
MTNNKQQTEINAVEYLGKVNQFAKENNTDKPKQQTAIEWLFDNVYMAHSELSEKLKQAKEIEKEQIEEAFANGVDDEYEWHINNVPRKNSETYYNETYGDDK